MKKVLLGVTAVCALGAAVVIAMAAAAFALYAALVPNLGPPWAAAIVAAVAAALVAIGALITGAKGKAGPRRLDHEPSMVERLTLVARDRPMLAAGAALAAGLIALKNPRLAAGLASAFMAGKAADKAERRSRW